MGRLLRQRRFGAYLALAALALQIALSFGHVHIAPVYAQRLATLQDSTSPNAARVTHQAAARTSDQAPAQNSDDDYCAICASIALVGASFVPEAPQLPVPAASECVEHVLAATAASIKPRHFAFQSRAPPAA